MNNRLVKKVLEAKKEEDKELKTEEGVVTANRRNKKTEKTK